MVHASLIPWLDPVTIIPQLGPWALLGICFIVFAETGLLVGFLLPGDTLLFFAGLLTHTGVISIDIVWVCLAIVVAAFLGGEVGYLIGHRLGPKVFERKESGLFSIKNVERTNMFFDRFGGPAVIIARFIAVVRTFAPVAAGVAHMNYRRYSLYNLIGAAIWGAGLVMLGYLLGGISWVSTYAEKYIDVVILGAVALTLVPMLIHYFRSSMQARRNAATGLPDVAVAGAAAAGIVTITPAIVHTDHTDPTDKPRA
ncbi:membrane-associated protein [Sanguibacter gelidistatuariae]|uniref:Membrane-associated protein n=1 Tax=Sanguibacter gelidistatuariae TaxID=1814289 RepID=A0A1G6QB13_9MICO|nr:VTT domain-containing protein [Sanguibacter gelidistatuariae]SDC88847.1 membrane-associated protein [Sanguibacter gelidistatuariae]